MRGNFGCCGSSVENCGALKVIAGREGLALVPECVRRE